MKTTLPLTLLLASTLLLYGCDPNACPTGGNGTIVVTYVGLPDGLAASTTLTGASSQTVTASQTLSSVSGGRWTVASERAVSPTPLVRTVYTAAASPASFCLAPGATQTVTVTWAQVPTSNKIWINNSTGGSGDLLGFSGSSLAASGNPAAAVTATSGAGHDLAFDKDGNLWSLGGTTADPSILRVPAAALATSGRKEPDRKINISSLSCLPGTVGLAFDPGGNLWVSSICSKKVYKLLASQLEASATVTPALELGGFDAPQGVAFDSAGNLWVGDIGLRQMLRFDAASLSSATATPSRRLAVRVSDNPVNMDTFAPGWLFFDLAGNLWSNDFGGNVLFRTPAARLAGTGLDTYNPAVRITVGVGALIENMAVDEQGGIWLAASVGRFARLAPSQLDTSTGPGAPTIPQTVVSSSDIGYVNNVAFYPAPAATPLFGRLP